MTTETNPTNETLANAAAGPTATDTTAIPAQPASEQEEPFDKDRAMKTIQNLRAIEKQAKQDQKELETLRAEQKKRAEAEMTEAEKLRKQADELAAQNAKLQSEMLRRDVIAEVGLPAIFADRLKGATKEELLADANELKKILPQNKQAPTLNPTNPSNASTAETEAQKRERLFGRQSNIFDINAIEATGGGVVWKQKPE